MRRREAVQRRREVAKRRRDCQTAHQGCIPKSGVGLTPLNCLAVMEPGSEFDIKQPTEQAQPQLVSRKRKLVDQHHHQEQNKMLTKKSRLGLELNNQPRITAWTSKEGRNSSIIGIQPQLFLTQIGKVESKSKLQTSLIVETKFSRAIKNKLARRSSTQTSKLRNQADIRKYLTPGRN